MKMAKKKGKSKNKRSKTKKKAKVFENMDEKLKNTGVNIAIWIGVFFLSLIVVDYAVQYYRYGASAAIVNGERIKRSEYLEKLESTYGSITAGQLIEVVLLRQESSEQGVEVSEENVEEQFKRDYIEAMGGREEFDKWIKDQTETEEDIKYRIETTLLREKMKDKLYEEKAEKPTEEDLKELFEEHKDTYIARFGEEVTYDDVKDTISEEIRVPQEDSLYNDWITQVYEEANIVNNVEDTKKIRFLGITRSLVTDMTTNQSEE